MHVHELSVDEANKVGPNQTFLKAKLSELAMELVWRYWEINFDFLSPVFKLHHRHSDTKVFLSLLNFSLELINLRLMLGKVKVWIDHNHTMVLSEPLV